MVLEVLLFLVSVRKMVSPSAGRVVPANFIAGEPLMITVSFLLVEVFAASATRVSL